mgnify:CR=1 FL=1
MAAWTDGYWWSNDGLRLHYRDYAGREDRPPIICLPGLTRNARDFAEVADRLAGEWRLLCVELRGRGESAHAKDPLTYVPLTYVQDIIALVTELKLARVVLFGTSLGGILTMLLGATRAVPIAGALINDIGPEIDPAGLQRIRTYVGKQVSYPTWIHAARGIAAIQGGAFPDYKLEDWIAMAKRIFRLTPAGRIVWDYDMNIAEPFRLPGGEGGVDLWPAFDGLAEVPLTLVRGELSDILTAETARRMADRHPGLDLVTVPRIGHAPMLTEEQCVAGIDRLLARVAIS